MSAKAVYKAHSFHPIVDLKSGTTFQGVMSRKGIQAVDGNPWIQEMVAKIQERNTAGH